MDFLEEQSRRSENTVVLWVPFIASAVLTVPFAYLSVVSAALLLALYFGKDRRVDPFTPVVLSYVNWHSFVIVGLVVFIVLLILMMWRRRNVEMTGEWVAMHLGGKYVMHTTTELKQKVLRDVVEEMAIAAEVPPPKIFVLPYSKAINAFTAGSGSKDRVVGVTEGALDELNRDELQAVVAHEMGHMIRGDVELNMNLMSILYGAYGVYSSGKFLMKKGSDEGTSLGFVVAVAGFLCCLAGLPGYLFGRWTVAVMLRQREYLADACATQWTRQREGLMGALLKMKRSPYGSRIEHPFIHEVEHMFFAPVEKEKTWGFLGTHPTVDERVKLIET